MKIVIILELKPFISLIDLMYFGAQSIPPKAEFGKSEIPKRTGISPMRRSLQEPAQHEIFLVNIIINHS